ncbi:MAG: hypothetical protein ABIJ09_18230 [Pseudomonadota bacterium]
MSFDIDDTGFPLVRISYPAQASLEEIEAYGTRLERVLCRGRQATVVDVRAVSVLQSGAEQRRYLAQQVDAATTRHPDTLVAEAVVLNSKILSAAYTAFNWLRADSTYPSRAFSTVEAAEGWARAQLLLAGIEAP